MYLILLCLIWANFEKCLATFDKHLATLSTADDCCLVLQECPFYEGRRLRNIPDFVNEPKTIFTLIVRYYSPGSSVTK